MKKNISHKSATSNQEIIVPVFSLNAASPRTAPAVPSTVNEDD